MITNEILESLDLVQESSIDAELEVINSMIQEFDKGFIMEAYVITESKKDESILDKVKKEGKNDDNKFITILMFIPRIIKAFAQKIKKAFDNADMGKKLKQAGEEFTKSADMREKEMRVKELNKELAGKGECYIDEKTGKIKFKKNSGGFIEKAMLISGSLLAAVDLFKRIKKEFDPTNQTAIQSFIDDCKKILTGRFKEVEKFDLFEDGVGALADMLTMTTEASGEVLTLSVGIQEMMESAEIHNKISDMPDKDKQARFRKINELARDVSIVTGTVTAGTAVISQLTKWAQLFCDWKNEGKRIDASFDEYMSRMVIKEGHVKKEEIEKDNPRGKNESEASYNARIDKIMLAKAKTILEGPVGNEMANKYDLKTYKQWVKDTKSEIKAEMKEADKKAAEAAKQEREKEKAEKKAAKESKKENK